MRIKLFVVVVLLIVSDQIYAQSEKEIIGKQLDAWHLAAAQADYDAYFSLMTDAAVFIGTDATENWQLEAFKQFSKPYFDKGKAWSFQAVERNVYLDKTGQLAWFDELLDTWMGICRGSGVVLQESGKWKIAHYVLSATIPNDDMDQVISIKQAKDSLQLIQLKEKIADQKK